jgi:hypothetical protein
MSNRTAIVVLACATPPYDQLIDAIRCTWGSQSVPGLDIYYLYGNPHDRQAHAVLSRYVGGHLPVVEDDAIRQIQDVLIAGCADHLRQQEDCLLRKRLIAYDHLAAAGRYDLIHTVCAASYVDQEQLARYADSLIPRRVVAGAIGLAAASRTPFVSGASMILSVDVARELANNRKEIIAGNTFGFRDDVTVGRWIVTRLSRVALQTFIDDIERRRPMTPDHVFVPCPHGTVNYVTAPAQEHRPVPNAFHYHFNSQRALDMVRFHQRYFEGLSNVPIDAPQEVARRWGAAAMNSYRPERRAELVIGQVADDFLVYDPVSDRTTLLNWSAAAVLELCDGERTVVQIIAEVAEAVSAPAGDLVAEIEEAIRSLAAKGLFVAQHRIVREGNGGHGEEDAGGTRPRTGVDR